MADSSDFPRAPEPLVIETISEFSPEELARIEFAALSRIPDVKSVLEKKFHKRVEPFKTSLLREAVARFANAAHVASGDEYPDPALEKRGLVTSGASQDISVTEDGRLSVSLELMQRSDQQLQHIAASVPPIEGAGFAVTRTHAPFTCGQEGNTRSYHLDTFTITGTSLEQVMQGFDALAAQLQSSQRPDAGTPSPFPRFKEQKQVSTGRSIP